jgi:hypothetical protein
MKFKSNFSFAKMLSYAKSKKFHKQSGTSIIDPMVKDSKKFIKANKVTPPTSTKTLKERHLRESPKSIGGNTTLYDTGKLHDVIKYGQYHLKGDGVPQRNFLVLDPKNEEKAVKKIVEKLLDVSVAKMSK